MTSFAFETSWGATVLADGRARFRLWAPAQQSVALNTPASVVPMARADDGWFEIETDAVRPGDAYSFRLADGRDVPDPAARAQVGDVHGSSRLVDPKSFEWRSGDWRGRPWEETVIYELHTGTFSPEGTFDGIASKLDHLEKLGVTAIELMPVAQFGGNRGWGYDGVLLYAPHNVYGGPDGLKRVIDAAHTRGLTVFLDVVYNHFGPDGNYLHAYAPEFFDTNRETPWGAAIAYEKPPVRAFVIENALYWLEEYRFDGLRFDAIDQINDPSALPILDELALTIRHRIRDRHIHLATEDDRNIVRLHERDREGRPRLFTAEWNDDVHHVAHVIATRDSEGYYSDYTESPTAKLARALAEGYVYQGEASAFRDGELRGEPSAGLPPSAFVNFLQNHDQIGNRAFGERLSEMTDVDSLHLLTAILLLSPQIPLMYMGEEWASRRPFCFFTDFGGDLASAVREGRRNEFRKWPQFADPKNREKIPDPNALSTFEASALDWAEVSEPEASSHLAFATRLLGIRAREIMPLIATVQSASYEVIEPSAFVVTWSLGHDGELRLAANFDDAPATISPIVKQSRTVYESRLGADDQASGGLIAERSVSFAVAAAA